MAELPPEGKKLLGQARAAMNELRRKWVDLGVPPAGQAGLLLAEYVNVCINDRGMTTAEVIAHIIHCFESQIVPVPEGQA